MSNTRSRQTFARNFVHAVTFRPFLRDLKRMHDAPRLFLRLRPHAPPSPPARATPPDPHGHRFPWRDGLARVASFTPERVKPPPSASAGGGFFSPRQPRPQPRDGMPGTGHVTEGTNGGDSRGAGTGRARRTSRRGAVVRGIARIDRLNRRSSSAWSRASPPRRAAAVPAPPRGRSAPSRTPRAPVTSPAPWRDEWSPWRPRRAPPPGVFPMASMCSAKVCVPSFTENRPTPQQRGRRAPDTCGRP